MSWCLASLAYSVEVTLSRNPQRVYFKNGIKTVQLNCSAHSKNIIITIIIDNENVLQCTQTKYPAVRNFWRILTKKAYSSFLKAFDAYLKLPSNSEKYFGFVADKFSEHAHTRKLWCLRHLELFVARPTSEKCSEFGQKFLIQTS